MNKEKLNKKIEELKQQFNQKLEVLKEEINSIEDEENKKSVRQKPEIGEEYYYLTDESRVNKAIWNSLYRDNLRFDIGNCFKTEQEALSYRENILTKQALKDLALELNNGVEIDWDNEEQAKYYIVFNKNTLFIGVNYTAKAVGLVYSLDRNFQDIAKYRIGEEKLIKLIKSGI